MERADVVVVGGGINGVATLYGLLQRGCRDVLLIERQSIASGPTGASVAIVRQHYSHETTARMALDSLRFFQHFAEHTGGDAEFREIGVLVGAAPADVPALKANVAMHRRIGIKVDLLTPADLREVEPRAIMDEAEGMAFEPESGYADPVRASQSFANWCLDHGARIWQNTGVRRLLVEGGRIAGVETARGPVYAERVVLAAGPWSAALAAETGCDLPLLPSRHPVATYHRPVELGLHRIMLDMANSMYLRPEGHGLTLAGLLDDEGADVRADPDEFLTRCTAAESEEIGARLVRRYPTFDALTVQGGWAGIYDVAPDWYHIIDELPTARGCFVVCGTSGMGFKLGPVVGGVLADLALGREPAYDISIFRLARFATAAAPTPVGAFASASIVG